MYILVVSCNSVYDHIGIGTDASISTHIQNLLNRTYCNIGPNRTMIPSKLGITLVHGYMAIDKDLVEPTIRSSIESSVSLIAKGISEYRVIVAYSLDLFYAKFQYFINNINRMDLLMSLQFNSIITQTTGRPLAKCGNCKKYMNLIVLNQNMKLYCSVCDTSYNLPKGEENKKSPSKDK